MQNPGLNSTAVWLFLLLVPWKLVSADDTQPASPRVHSPLPPPAFQPDRSGGYTFDTGLLRGRLHHAGKPLGLTEVVHLPSGRTLSGAYGLLSPYRVFSGHHRYGTAAWDWPATTRLLDAGTVEVRWAAAPDRPFELRTLYRWLDPTTIQTEVAVIAERALPEFEIFLASYFDGAFADPSVYVAGHPLTGNRPGLLPARKEFGDWQMFPRDAAAVPWIQDGRWRLEPHPVEWTMLPQLAAPLAVRRAEGIGLIGVLMAPASDCFAIATPYAGENHYSIYLSLFGHDLTAGLERTAKARLVIGPALPDAEIIEHYGQFP